MHNGIDPMPAINKWKSWIEDNSKFNITIIYNKYPELESNEIPQKGYWDDGTPNYFVYPKDLSDVHKALIPKDTIVNFVLWNNEGKSPSMGGAEFGYNQYDQFQPFLSIPIGLWWDDGPDQQWTYPLTSGMVHEFENAIFGIVNTWLKIPDMATPEGCGGYGYNSSNDPEWIKCRTYVLSTITDKMYQAILAYQAVLSSPTAQVGEWVEKADTPSAGGYGETVVSTNNSIYIARNLYATTNPLFWQYNTSINIWSSMSVSGLPLGAFRNGATLAWNNGSYIYALLGARYSDTNRRLFYRYSMTNNNWEQLADTPHAQGAGDAITWSGYDGYIYAIIGSAKHGTAFARYKYNSWEVLDLNPNWTVTDDGASLAWTGGQYLYALRGEYAETVPNGDFARYHIPSQSWVDMKDIPEDEGVGDGASLLWVGEYSDDIFALGGGDVYENPGYNFYSYSISTNSWGQLESIPCPIGYYVGNRLGFANGSIYYWQGSPTTDKWICGGDAFYMFKQPVDTIPPAPTPTPTPTPTPDICSWVTAKGGVNDLSVSEVSELLDGYLGFKQIGFVPTVKQVYGVCDYYLGFISSGNQKTGCAFTPSPTPTPTPTPTSIPTPTITQTPTPTPTPTSIITQTPTPTPTPTPTITPTPTPTPTPTSTPPISYNVAICEIIYDPPGQEPDDELIKLCNRDSTTVDISGWKLTDGEGTYTIPSGTTITAGSSWSVFGNTYNPTRYTRGLYLANTHDEVILYNKNGNKIDEYSW